MIPYVSSTLPLIRSWSLSVSPENSRKPTVFWCFQGVTKETSGMKWINVTLHILLRYTVTIWQHKSILTHSAAGIYMLKVNNKNTRTRCEIGSKLTIKIRHWTCNSRLGLSQFYSYYPFHAYIPFLYSLKTSKKLLDLWRFQGV